MISDNHKIQRQEQSGSHTVLPECIDQWLLTLRQEFQRYSQELSWHSNYKIVQTAIFSSTLDFTKIVFEQFSQQIEQESRSQQQQKQDSQIEAKRLQDKIQEDLLDMDQSRNSETKETTTDMSSLIIESRQTRIEQDQHSFSNKFLKEKSSVTEKKILQLLIYEKETIEMLNEQDNKRIAQRQQRIQEYNLRIEKWEQDQGKAINQILSQLSLSELRGDLSLDNQKLKSLRVLSLQIRRMVIQPLKHSVAEGLRLIDMQYNQTISKYMRVSIPLVMKMIQGLLMSQEGKHLFNSEKRQMWYKGLSQQQISSKLESYTIDQIEELKQEIVILQQQIEQRSFDIKEKCKRHMKSVLYFCNNQALSENAYLCEQCIQDIGVHFGHQIRCKIHKQPVRYLHKYERETDFCEINLENTNKRIIVQALICDSCYLELKEDQLQKRSQITLLASCHHLATARICFDYECIISNDYKICDLCLRKHDRHETISFKRQALLEALDINKEDDITAYESFYLDIREKLQMNPTKKAVDSKASQLWPIMKFIQGFAVHNNELLEKWVDFSLMKGQKEDLFVLWAINQLKRRRFSTRDKREYLQVFSDILRKQLETLFENIDSQLQRFKKSVERCMLLQTEEVEEHLNQKYKEVVNKSKGKIEQPMSIMGIQLVHYHRIVKVNIDQQGEEDHKERVLSEWQAALQLYFILIFQQKCRNRKVSQFDKKNILEMIEKYGQWRPLIHYQQKFKELGIQKYLQLAIEIKKQIIELGDKFKTALSTPTALDWFLKNKLANLRILSLSYPKKSELGSFKLLKYSVNAFALFQQFQYHPSLVDLSISGFQVEKFGLFLYCAREAVMNKQPTDLRISKQQIDEVRKSWEWLKSFNPKAINLSIDTSFQFSLRSEKAMHACEVISDALKLFSSIRDMTIKLDVFVEGQVDAAHRRIDLLLNWLSIFTSVKLVIDDDRKANPTFLAYFLGKLALFTTITELTFKYITLDEGLQENNMAIKGYLQQLFANNIITNLCLEQCKNILISPTANSLQGFVLKCDADFKEIASFITQIFSNNGRLASIRLQIKKDHQIYKNQYNFPDQTGFSGIDLSKLPLLQELQAYLFNLDFSNLSNCPYTSLRSLSLKATKYRQGQCLESLFPKLSYIRQLELKNIIFNGQLLLVIPSMTLQDLSLLDCESIVNKDIQNVDHKWPYLKSLAIKRCRGVNGKIFGKCKFRGIRQLSLQQSMLKESDTVLEYLKKRGIRIYL